MHLNVSMCISLFTCRSPNKHKQKTPLSVCVFVEASQCVNKSLGKEKQTKLNYSTRKLIPASALSANKHFSTSMDPFLTFLSFLSLWITFTTFSVQCLWHPNKYNHFNLCTRLLLCATTSACACLCHYFSLCVCSCHYFSLCVCSCHYFSLCACLCHYFNLWNMPRYRPDLLTCKMPACLPPAEADPSTGHLADP